MRYHAASLQIVVENFWLGLIFHLQPNTASDIRRQNRRLIGSGRLPLHVGLSPLPLLASPNEVDPSPSGYGRGLRLNESSCLWISQCDTQSQDQLDRRCDSRITY